MGIGTARLCGSAAGRALRYFTVLSLLTERRWWLYTLEFKGGSLYTGITVDLERRLAQHRRGTAATYTRMRRPLRLVGAAMVGARSCALKLEYAFKQLPADEKWRRATAMGVTAASGASSVMDVDAA